MVFLASQPADFREEPDGQVALMLDTSADPLSGSLWVLRVRRGTGGAATPNNTGVSTLGKYRQTTDLISPL
jgi:hypothetical protein